MEGLFYARQSEGRASLAQICTTNYAVDDRPRRRFCACEIALPVGFGYVCVYHCI